MKVLVTRSCFVTHHTHLICGDGTRGSHTQIERVLLEVKCLSSGERKKITVNFTPQLEELF